MRWRHTNLECSAGEGAVGESGRGLLRLATKAAGKARRAEGSPGGEITCV